MRDLPTAKCDCALDQYTTFFKNAGTCYYQSIGKGIGNVQVTLFALVVAISSSSS